MTGFISFAFTIAMIPWRAFVLFKLWYWFLVPVWPMLAIPKWNLYGVAMLIGFLTADMRNLQTKDDGMNKWVYLAAMSFLSPAMMLLTSWLIKVICL